VSSAEDKLGLLRNGIHPLGGEEVLGFEFIGIDQLHLIMDINMIDLKITVFVSKQGDGHSIPVHIGSARSA
jgi:hypothetical protein